MGKAAQHPQQHTQKHLTAVRAELALQAHLRRARWNVKAAIVMEKTDDTYSGALSRLKQAGQSVRAAIGEDVEPTLRRSLRTR